MPRKVQSCEYKSEIGRSSILPSLRSALLLHTLFLSGHILQFFILFSWRIFPNRKFNYKANIFFFALFNYYFLNNVVDTLRERDHWGDPDVDGRIILRWIFRKWEGVLGTGWSWLRIRRGGGHL